MSVSDLLGDDLGDAGPVPDAQLDFKDVSSELGRALAGAADAHTTDSEVPVAPKRSASELRGAQPKRASEIRGAPADRVLTGPAFGGGMGFGSASAPSTPAGPPPPPPATAVGPAPTPKNPFGGGLSELGDTDQDDVLGFMQQLQGQGGGARTGGSAGLKMGGSAAGDFGSAGIPEEDPGGFRSESTVVSAPDDDLLARSVAGGLTGHYQLPTGDEARPPDTTVVANVPQELIDRSAEITGQMNVPDEYGLDAADNAHFQETYERFVEMRRACGEPTADLAFDKFVAKLRKNRGDLVEKYNCRTVRFQVYRKDGKAALKATPIRA